MQPTWEQDKCKMCNN